jgi:hypothetical protein
MTTNLKSSEIRSEFVLGDPSMGREPGSRQRSVALAGVDMNVSIGVFAIAVDDVLAVECVVLVKQFVRPKAVGVDGQRLLFAVSKQDSNRRFISGFRW